MTTQAALLHAPHGSVCFLDAVQATLGTMSDRQFAALMRRRERIAEADAETLRFDGELRAKLRPPIEPVARRVPMTGRTMLRTVMVPSWEDEHR